MSHEDLTDAEIPNLIADYEARLGLPTTDVLNYGCQKLIQVLRDRFPSLPPSHPPKRIETMPSLALR